MTLENQASPGAPASGPERPRSVADSWAFRNRGLLGGLCLAPAVLAAVFGSPWFASVGVFAWTADLLGWLFFLAYVAMRIWATLYIGGAKDRRLQTKGPYSVTRNPLYVGSLCFALSIACFLKSLSVVALTLLASGIYIYWVVRAEEDVLQGIFGAAFTEYLQRTPRVIPRFALYQAAPTVEVNLRAFRTEAQRLLVASSMPFLALFVFQSQRLAWWPHWFRLP